MAKGLRQPVGATKAWSTRILEPTDHISRVGQDSEVTKSTRSVVVANPVIKEVLFFAVCLLVMFYMFIH